MQDPDRLNWCGFLYMEALLFTIPILFKVENWLLQEVTVAEVYTCRENYISRNKLE